MNRTVKISTDFGAPHQKGRSELAEMVNDAPENGSYVTVQFPERDAPTIIHRSRVSEVSA